MRHVPKLDALGAGPPRPPAPFVVGMPRSGTTLLRLMLDAHPELAIPPETHFIPAALAAARGPGAAQAFCEAIVGHPRFGDFGLDAGDLRRRIEALVPFDPSDGLRAFYHLYADRHEKPRWGDKTPGYLRRMGMIQAALPEARFVHLIRDGRDVACSIVPLPWGPDSVEEAARWWADGIAEARRQATSLTSYTEVRYEDLLTEPRTALAAACGSAALAFDPAMLEYHRTAGARMAEIERDLPAAGGGVALTAARRAEIHRLTRARPQPDRAGRWRSEMPAADRRRFEAVAGRMLAELGYRDVARSSS